MSRKLPPIDKRFPVNRPFAPHTKKHPNGYLTPLLKKLLLKKIKYIDPETQKIIQGKVKDAVLWRLILNATEGETQAVKEILDRIDGKVTTPIEHSGEVTGTEHKINIIIPKERAEDARQRFSSQNLSV